MTSAALLAVYLLATTPSPAPVQANQLSRYLDLESIPAVSSDAAPVQSLASNELTTLAYNTLVKRVLHDGIYTPGRFPAQAACSPFRFSPSGSVAISPYSNDPNRVTPFSELLTLPNGCPFFDGNGDGTYDFNFYFNPRSLRDLGEHEFSCFLDTVPHSGWCVSAVRPPCNYICEASVAVRQFINPTYNVVNLAPTASPSYALATPPVLWGGTVQLKANSNDPDGGSVIHRWIITSKPPASTRGLTNANTANPTLQGITEKDIGTWVFRLEVDDDEGEMKTFPVQFTIANAAPQFEATGASQVVVQKNIQVGVTNTHDEDGGELTFRWDILSAPTGSTPGVQTGYSTQSSLSIPTTGKEVGTWRFKVTGTDNEGASLSREITVTVVNIKPRIQLSGATHVDEGNPIQLETTILDDEDGGQLTFKWEVVQAPYDAGVAVPSVLSSSATMNVAAFTSSISALAGGSAQAVPGTWIFRLTATDNEDESVNQEVTVLLDGMPKFAFRDPPSRHVIGSGPLVLDASISEDPDSPCPTEPGRCHLTDGRFVTVSPGLTGVYEWYASQDLSQHPLAPISTLFPSYSTTGPILTLGAETVPAGEWTFEVRGLDGEGNPGSKQISVSVLPPDTAPQAVVNGPLIRPTVLLSGLNLAPIVVDGSASMDLDNTFDGTAPAPGMGITHYQWSATPPTAACPVPTLPSGPSVTNILLFPAGANVPPACQGRWQITLTVTDDDQAGKQGSLTVPVSIGNCASLACLDSPLPGNARVLHENDTSGVLVAVHLDSAFYDEVAFATGTAIIMDVVYSGTTQIAYKGVTPLLNQSSRGLPLFLHWNGTNASGARVSGTFDIILSVQTGVGQQLAVAAGPQVIVVENVETQVSSSSDRYVQREKLLAASATANFRVSATGLVDSVPVDSYAWRIKNTGGTTVASGTLTGGGEGEVRTANWNGKNTAGVVPPAGDYTFEAEAIRGGVPLGVSPPRTFTLYGLALDPMVVAPATPGESPEWVHLERPHGTAIVTAANFTQKRPRMSPLSIKVDPLLPGFSLTFEQESGPTGLVEFYEEGTLYRPLGALPLQLWDIPAGGLKLLAYGREMVGEAVFKLTYRVNGDLLAEERVRYRLAPTPAAVGIEDTVNTPHFRELRTVNVGRPVKVALDRTRQRERTGRRANVYLVAHRDAVLWAANANLVQVPAAGAVKQLDVGAANVDPEILTLWAAAAEGSYDVVYDFGNFADAPADFVGDGRLDPGDLLVSPEGLPAVDVEGSYVTPGGLGIQSFEFGDTFSKPKFTTRLPGGWDEVTPAGALLPLRGLAVFPTDLSVKRPLVMIAHGNHTPRTLFIEPAPGAKRVAVTVDPDMTSSENYQGYRYLQEHLASQGFITVSIDLDGLSGNVYGGYPAIPPNRWRPTPGIQARAWVLLKNLELLLTNSTAVPAIAGKIDASRIYLMGHSRGGEAAVVAQHQLIQYASGAPAFGSVPPGGTLTGLSPSNIKGIISLAPVSFAVEKLPITPSNVPYLLMYGSADGDVNGAMSTVRPFIHYDRAQGDRFALRIEGANHNHFNTSWPASDANVQLLWKGRDPITYQDQFDRQILDTPVGAAGTLIDGAPQRLVATAYITAFLRFVDEGSRAAGDYFLQQPATLAPLGTPAGLSMYSQARLATRTRLVLDDYESNSQLTLSSAGAPVTSTLAELSEGPLLDTDLLLEAEPANRFFQATKGARFAWNGNQAYEQTVPVGKQDLRLARSLNFRVAQVPGHAYTAAGTALSFRVELEDGAGHVEAMSLNGFGQVPSIYGAGIWWPEDRYRDDGSINPISALMNTTSAAFKTFRLPLAGFAGTATDVDLGNITKVRIRLADGETAQGSVALDDLEIEF
ncbi:FlgD immunoglobulin-like domain containing protein [Corallococcus sp. AB045]|uniref:FlgD immunoglobulin-like domain containing protein n=1 Tax=Corallococcus sp. AB045 TaxID=2316719 RepID=UPI0011C42B35|nr:FlgD immunoglobulin-like domain containing protein [Corallococcus sp. AB045]